MNRVETVRVVGSYIHLFDQDGLPWTSRVRWGVLFIWLFAIFILLGPLVGIYLGLWLISKGRPALSLILYLALTVVSTTAFFAPFPSHGALSGVETALGALILVLWLAGAFALRREVIHHYFSREGIQFSLNPALTALVGPWYVSSNLRADFPLNVSGKTGEGILKLIV